MLRKFLTAGALLSLAACVSIEVTETEHGDATLTAFESARVRECPTPATMTAIVPAGLTSVGVTGVDIAFTPLASDPTRVVRLRRLTIAPRGSIGWHDHTGLQGMALIVAGEMVEYRTTCAVPVIYRAGDVAIEDAATHHAWRNDTDEPAVVLTAHVLPRP